MKKEIYFAILGLVIAELMIFFGKISLGLIVHIINIFGITFLIIFSNLDLEIKNILQSFTLIILLRLVNFAMPQFFNSIILQYPLIYGVMFLAIYSIVKNQQITVKELGFNIEKKLLIYIPLAGLIGIAMAMIEYNIVSPIPLFKNINFSDLILIAIIMIIFIGPVEELIFRSILQTRIKKVYGSKSGILLSGGIFGMMHLSYGLISEIIFAGIFGIILGYFFEKTRNLLFIISIHGFENITLFGILPIINMSIK